MTWRSKLFYSHLFVVSVSIAIVAIVALIISAFTFDEITQDIREEATISGGTFSLQTTDVEVSSVDEALNTALIIGLGAATVISMLVAACISLTLSKRLTTPIRDMIAATQHIAEGHYDQRVKHQSQDEIGELADYFNHMAQSLDEVETTRRQLLADVTHELNTPLTSIIGCIEGFQDGTLTSIETTHTIIYDEALRLQGLVRDVQYLSTIESGVYELHRNLISVCELLRSVAVKLLVQFESKAVDLTIQYPPPSVMTCVDQDRIIQVLINVLGNALQYTPSGGYVNVNTRLMIDSVELIVTDNGIGIAAVDLKQIFIRFYRVEKSRSRTSGGSGIGLTIARHIVEAHGGRIWAESEGLGSGSQFHLVLPLHTTSSKLNTS